MWKSLLLLGCISLFTAGCATVDKEMQIGKEKRVITATCLTHVGTHIRRPGRCVNAPGRTYTNGGSDSFGAWWQDPAIQISR